MANNAGTLEIDIVAGLARLHSDMKEAHKTVKESMEGINKSVDLAKKGLELLGLAWGVSQIKEWLSANAEAIDANAKMADRLGITTEAMTGIRAASDLAGVSIETVSTGMRTMQNAAYQAAQGVGQYSAAFASLHINADQFVRLAPDQQLQSMLDHLAGLSNVTERNALAMQVFGGRATEMLNLIADGSGAIKEATEDAKAWGLALDRVDSAKVEAANDAMTRAKSAMQGVANTINVALSPYIAALAKDFSDSAKSAHGFREEIMDGMEKVATVVAYTANVIRGLHVAWKIVEVATAEVLNGMIQIVNGFVQTVQTAYNKLADSYIGKKMGIPISTFGDTLNDVADSSQLRVKELEDELQKLAAQKMPAEGIQEWFKKVREEADRSAKEVAASRKKQQGGGGGFIDPEKDAADFLKQDAIIKQQVAALSESYMTKEQLEAAHYEKTRQLLEDASARGAIADDTYKELREQAELRHQAALGDISAQGILQRQKFEQMTGIQQTQFVLGQLLQMTNGVAAHNKTMFEINKIAGIANAVINTAQGVTMALRSYPPPLSFAMAAAQLAAGVAQINQIKSASFGGTSAPSVAGGGAIPVTPAANSYAPPQVADQNQQQGQSAVVVNINGTLVGNEAFVYDVVVPTIRDAVANKDIVLIDSTSRNGLELTQ